MPTYGYRCTVCKHEFERIQKISDAPLSVCESCGEPVKRIIYPVGIQFKGTGFYVTDYNNKGSEKSKESAKEKESDSGSSDAATDTKADTKTETKTETKSMDTKSETKSERSESKSDPATPAKPAK